MQARRWWTGEIARVANTRSSEPSELVSPLDVSELIALVETGDLTDRLARQVLEGVIEGEGRPSEVVEKRGLKVVSDDGALIAAIDESLAVQPDVLEKIRDGEVQVLAPSPGPFPSAEPIRPLDSTTSFPAVLVGLAFVIRGRGDRGMGGGWIGRSAAASLARPSDGKEEPLCGD